MRDFIQGCPSIQGRHLEFEKMYLCLAVDLSLQPIMLILKTDMLGFVYRSLVFTLLPALSVFCFNL